MNSEIFKKGLLGRMLGLFIIVSVGVGVTCGGNYTLSAIFTPLISDIWYTLWILWLIECLLILLYSIYQVIFRFEEISFMWVKTRLFFIFEISLFLSLMVLLPFIIFSLRS